MGAWGVGLYSDDYASDVRADYRDALKFGKTDEEALAEVIEKDAPKPRSEDEFVFWYALADTLWNYGRLTPEIRGKALYFLDNSREDDRWDSEKTWEKRKLVLTKLKEKLLTEQPPRKRVSRYVPYVCPWKRGDVYAYQMQKPRSEEYGVQGKYILFCKVDEHTVWPNNTIPLVYIYKWMGDTIPSPEEVKTFQPLIIDYLSLYQDYAKYLCELFIGSTRVLHAMHLQYVGNIAESLQLKLTEEQRSDSRYTSTYAGNFENEFLAWYTNMDSGTCRFNNYV